MPGSGELRGCVRKRTGLSVVTTRRMFDVACVVVSLATSTGSLMISINAALQIGGRGVGFELE